MNEATNKGEVKIGDEFYTWRYNEQAKLFEAWNKQKVQVTKQEMTKKEFEELSVASFIKHSMGK